MTNTDAIARTETGSQLVSALEQSWAEIREHNPDVPDVVIITGSGSMGLGLVWGHYGHDLWRNGRYVAHPDGVIERERKPELFVSGETLGVGAAKTVQTMLHEAAHAVAAVRGVKDVSRQGRYHNSRFRRIAEQLGLEHRRDRPSDLLGFSRMELADQTRERYADVIGELDAAIALSMELPAWLAPAGAAGQGGDGGDGGRRPRDPGRPRTGYRKAVCGCGRTIRVAPSTLADAPIACRRCGEDFALAD